VTLAKIGGVETPPIFARVTHDGIFS